MKMRRARGGGSGCSFILFITVSFRNDLVLVLSCFDYCFSVFKQERERRSVVG